MIKRLCTIRTFLLIMVLLSTAYCETFAQARPITKVLFAEPVLDKNTDLYDLNVIWEMGHNDPAPQSYLISFYERNTASFSKQFKVSHSSVQETSKKFSYLVDADAPEGEYVVNVYAIYEGNQYADSSCRYSINIGKNDHYKRAEFLSANVVTTSLGDYFHKIDFRVSTDNGATWTNQLPGGWKIKYSFNQFWYDRMVSKHTFNDQTGELYLNVKDKGSYLWWWFQIVDENGRNVSQRIHKIEFKVLDTKPESHTIRGVVTDANTQQGIKNAMITLMGGGANSILRYTAMTDDNGMYSVEALAGNYTAHCIVPRNNMMSPCYLEQYYKNTTDRTQAMVIKVDADKQGIDFSLQPCSQENNRIAGIVTDSKNMPIPSSVVAFRLPEGNEDIIIRSTTAEAGNFMFEKLKVGNYLLFAFPSGVTAIPGFYKANDFATLEWQKATLVKVTSNSTSQIVIKLRDLRSLMGKGGIKGWVNRGGGAIKADDVQGAEPVNGAIAYAIDVNGEVRDFALTNEQGLFELTSLNKGKYTLHIERVGYIASVSEVIIEGDETTTEVTKQLAPAITTGIDENGVSENTAVVPNPADNMVTVHFNSFVAETATVGVYDMMGKRLIEQTMNAQAGANEVILNTSGLTSGSYTVKVETGSDSIAIPMKIVR